MGKWSILHRVRYPPFDDRRINPEAAPISEKIVETNLSKSDIKNRLPPYRIESEEGWLIQRLIVDENGDEWSESTDKRKDSRHLSNW